MTTTTLTDADVQRLKFLVAAAEDAFKSALAFHNGAVSLANRLIAQAEQESK